MPNIVLRILIFIGCFAAGLGLIAKTLPWVNLVGYSSWAEQHLGGGGTYTMWKLIGILLIIAGVMVLVGTLPV
ncbi:MAG: hypothetical protein WCW17_02665 [Patescibacteria group bacterium]|jgi:uncharacterized membrane protein YphA (DoxX/SURF4 family)